MDGTWWTAADQIDNDQRALIEIAVNSGHVLVTGPPGSGKTNVLLLRASYLGRAGEKNCAVLVFTRELREFIVAGTDRPNMVPAARIQTHAKWTWDLLGKLGRPLKPFKGGVGHDEARLLRHQALERAVQELGLPDDYFDSILLDEVQDYLACEVELLSKLTKRLFVVGDREQRIYDKNEGLRTAKEVGCEEYGLKFHYRLGRKICAVADRLRSGANPESLEQNCQYDERARPSRVEVHRATDIEAQLTALVPILERQLRAYPDEWLGVIAVTRKSRDRVVEFLKAGPLASQVLVQSENSDDRTFDPAKRIVVSTLHSAKGTEFRAVHFMAADDFPRYTREKAFTAVTRAKTALDVYHSGPMDGSLESALARPAVPDLEDLF